MARNKQPVEEEDVETNDSYRVSITIDPSIRRNMRIAAAYADQTVGEWAAGILERAAEAAVPDLKLKAVGD